MSRVRRKIEVPTVQQLQEQQTPDETIADAVKNVSEGTKKLLNGRLNKRALLLLLSHASGVSQRQVESVLDAMAGLEKRYLK